MVNFQAGKLLLDYPIYGSKFLNENTLLVTGGGGEGNNGIPNKITACTVDFNRTKIIKRFRELSLADDEDAPTCLDANNNVIIFSCNQSSDAIKAGSNLHLRKYGYINAHLRFLAQSQINDSQDPTEYTKSVSVSEDGSIACLSSSQNGEIFIIDTDTLEVKFNIDTKTTVKDLCISSDGKILAYLTQASVEFISTVTGNVIASQAFSDVSVSKIKFIGNNSVIIASSLKKTQGLALIEYSLDKKATTRQKVISKKTRGVTSMACHNGLIALGGNDTSIILVKASNFSVIKQFLKVHTFAITTVQISPEGEYLASTSADNSINVFKLPPKLATSSSFIMSVLTKFFTFLFVILLAVIIQWAIRKRVINDLIGYYKGNLDSSGYFTIQPIGDKGATSVESISTSSIATTTSSALEPIASEEVYTAVELESSSISEDTKSTSAISILTSSTKANKVRATRAPVVDSSTEIEAVEEVEEEAIISSSTSSIQSSKSTESTVESTSGSSSTTPTTSPAVIAPSSSSTTPRATKKAKKTNIKRKAKSVKSEIASTVLSKLSSLTSKTTSSITDSLALTVSPSTEVVTPSPSSEIEDVESSIVSKLSSFTKAIADVVVESVLTSSTEVSATSGGTKSTSTVVSETPAAEIVTTKTIDDEVELEEQAIEDVNSESTATSSANDTESDVPESTSEAEVEVETETKSEITSETETATERIEVAEETAVAEIEEDENEEDEAEPQSTETIVQTLYTTVEPETIYTTVSAPSAKETTTSVVAAEEPLNDAEDVKAEDDEEDEDVESEEDEDDAEAEEVAERTEVIPSTVDEVTETEAEPEESTAVATETPETEEEPEEEIIDEREEDEVVEEPEEVEEEVVEDDEEKDEAAEEPAAEEDVDEAAEEPADEEDVDEEDETEVVRDEL